VVNHSRFCIRPYTLYQLISDTQLVCVSDPKIIGVKPSLEVRWMKMEAEKKKRRLLQFQSTPRASFISFIQFKPAAI